MKPAHALTLTTCLFMSIGWASSGSGRSALDTLVLNSPFDPASAAASIPAQAEQPLDFKGMFEEGGETYISLYFLSSRQSIWVRLNEPGHPALVTAFDALNATVTVEYQGRVLTLPLKKSGLFALPTALAGNIPTTGPVPVQTPGPSTLPMTTGNTLPSPEAMRLAEIAEETRRRQVQGRIDGPVPKIVPGTARELSPQFAPLKQPSSQAPLPFPSRQMP